MQVHLSTSLVLRSAENSVLMKYFFQIPWCSCGCFFLSMSHWENWSVKTSWMLRSAIRKDVRSWVFPWTNPSCESCASTTLAVQSQSTPGAPGSGSMWVILHEAAMRFCWYQLGVGTPGPNKIRGVRLNTRSAPQNRRTFLTQNP